MTKHEDLSTCAKLWWLRREVDDFTMKPFGHDEAFQLLVFHRGIRRVFTGTLQNAISDAYGFIAQDTEQYHSRVREFFRVAIGDIPEGELKPIVIDEVPSS